MHQTGYAGLHTLTNFPVEAIVGAEGDRWFGHGTFDRRDPLAERRMEADRLRFEASAEMLCALRVAEAYLEAGLGVSDDRCLREVHEIVRAARRRADGLPEEPWGFDWDDWHEEEEEEQPLPGLWLTPRVDVTPICAAVDAARAWVWRVLPKRRRRR